VSYRYKSQHELVSSADEMSERLILSAIERRFPGHSVLSEESAERTSAEASTGPLWIVDPIDGTANLAHGLDAVAIAIAYAEDGVVKAAVVHAPFRGETYAAARGAGARRNGRPIGVSDRKALREALIGTGFPHDRSDLGHLLRRLGNVLRSCQGVRRLGSPALDMCLVADGRLDGYYETVFPWDVAAAGLIAREAGAAFGHLTPVPPGTSPDLHGRDVVVATPGIFRALTELLANVD
jgi:myo-inositol-1(or 4)-monophosphatase